MRQQTLGEYIKAKYGMKLYKVSINAGFTCPNRDGTIGTGGCIFCSGYGSGDFASDPDLSITGQIDAGKQLISAKLPKQDYGLIAYFQAFTNTYAPVRRLREVYMEAVRHPEVKIISIATRPDCIGEDVLDLISETNRIKPVWIELGLQTIHEKSADYIRRGYKLEVYDEAVRNLRMRGIETIVHVILGLPYEYVGLIKDALDILPEDIVIHRMTGDGAKKTLIAPLWSADKKKVLTRLRKEL